jgi:hypothetical protein
VVKLRSVIYSSDSIDLSCPVADAGAAGAGAGAGAGTHHRHGLKFIGIDIVLI